MAGTWVLHNSFREFLGDGTIDMDDDQFRVALAGASYAPNVETHSVLADVTDLLSGSGYAAQLVTQSWTRSGAEVDFGSSDPSFQASGGAFSPSARYAILYDDTPTSPADPIIGHLDLETVVAVADGQILRIDMSGVIT